MFAWRMRLSWVGCPPLPSSKDYKVSLRYIISVKSLFLVSLRASPLLSPFLPPCPLAACNLSHAVYVLRLHDRVVARPGEAKRVRAAARQAGRSHDGPLAFAARCWREGRCLFHDITPRCRIAFHQQKPSISPGGETAPATARSDQRASVPAQLTTSPAARASSPGLAGSGGTA